jgi:hypothetical protein
MKATVPRMLVIDFTFSIPGIIPNDMDIIIGARCYTPGVISRSARDAIVIGEPHVRLPLGVNYRRGAEEQGGKGAKEDNKQTGTGAGEHGGLGERNQTAPTA